MPVNGKGLEGPLSASRERCDGHVLHMVSVAMPGAQKKSGRFSTATLQSTEFSYRNGVVPALPLEEAPQRANARESESQ
jgi:hypothetical protein